MALVAGCGEWDRTEGGTPGAVFDAGPVFFSKTPRVTHRFEVRNTTDRSVRILGESHSCTCTDITLDHVTLEPGQSTPLTMTARASGDYAEMAVTCQVKTDHPEQPLWPYELRFESYPDTRIVPDRIDLGRFDVGRQGTRISPGSLGAGEATSVWLDVYAPPGDALPVPERIEAPSAVSVVLGDSSEVFELPGGVRRVRYPLEVRHERGDRKLGTFSESVRIILQRALPAGATLVWTNQAVIACTPARLHLGMAEDYRPLQGSLLVRSIDETPFRITNIDSEPHTLGVKLQLEQGETATVVHRLAVTLS